MTPVLRKKISPNEALTTLFTYSIFVLLFCLTIGAGPVRPVLYGVFIFYALLGLISVEKAAVVFIILAPFQFLVRQHNLQHIQLALWRETLFCILIFCWYLYFCTGRLRSAREAGTMFIICLNAVGVLTILNTSSPMVGFAGFKETVRFAALYLVVFSLLRKNPNVAMKFTYATVAGGLIYVIIHLYGYFAGSDFMRPDFQYPMRTFCGIPMYRMSPFVVGGPAELGRLAAGFAALCLSLNVTRRRNEWFWMLAFACCAVAAFVTVSQTALAVLAIGLMLVSIGSRPTRRPTKQLRKVLIGMLFIFVAILLLAPRFWATTAGTYTRAISSIQFWGQLVPKEILPFFLGNGFRTGSSILLGTGRYEDSGAELIIDWGWGGLAYQMGTPIAIAAVLFILILPVFYFVRLRHRMGPELSHIFLTSCIGVIVFTMDIHSIPWSRLGADAYIFVFLAIVMFCRHRLRSGMSVSEESNNGGTPGEYR